MTDEPDNWRSIGQVLSGMLKRGDQQFGLPSHHFLRARTGSGYFTYVCDICGINIEDKNGPCRIQETRADRSAAFSNGKRNV